MTLPKCSPTMMAIKRSSLILGPILSAGSCQTGCARTRCTNHLSIYPGQLIFPSHCCWTIQSAVQLYCSILYSASSESKHRNRRGWCGRSILWPGAPERWRGGRLGGGAGPNVSNQSFLPLIWRLQSGVARPLVNGQWPGSCLLDHLTSWSGQATN